MINGFRMLKKCFFLSDRFSNDKYYYFEIDQREVAKKRKEKCKEHFLKGSTRMHMITVKDDIFHTQDILCTRGDTLLTLRFDEANEDSGSDDDDDGQEMNNEIDSDEEQNNEAIIDEVETVKDGRIDHDCLFSAIFPNMFVALRSPPSSIDSFFVLKVKTKDVAKEMITDECNHTILAGEHYIN